MSAVVLPMRQRTPEWLEARQSGIGSSDAPIVAGVSRWGDLRTLYAEKLGLTAPVVETERMSWGLRLEDVIADAYVERTGRRVRRARHLLRHPDLAWMLASLDRQVLGQPGIVEIKTTGHPTDEWGPDGSDLIPEAYLVQVQHAMAVAGAEWADLAALFAGQQLRIYRIGRDAGLIDMLIDLEGRFWQHVTTRTPPPDMNPATRPALVREGVEPATPQVTSLAGRLRALRAAAEAADAAKTEAEDELRAALGAAAEVAGDGFRIVYRPNRDSKRTDWKLVAGAYRKALESPVDVPLDLDAIESLFTVTTPGARPLRVRWTNEEDTPS